MERHKKDLAMRKLHVEQIMSRNFYNKLIKVVTKASDPN